jgi:phage baseplate assembly protein W|tara:strand:+ start:83 stop:502 length:420 start_codon:yes stop_codon:yes gene_type:complete
MAYLVKSVDILDLQPSTGVGIKIPFDGQTGVTTTFTTKDAIKSNLLNFLLTGKRERILNPGFGSGLREILFQPLSQDTIDQVEELIAGGVESFFPQVIINNLDVQIEQETSTLSITLGYSVINTNIEDQLQINVNNGGV